MARRWPTTQSRFEVTQTALQWDQARLAWKIACQVTVQNEALPGTLTMHLEVHTDSQLPRRGTDLPGIIRRILADRLGEPQQGFDDLPG